MHNPYPKPIQILIAALTKIPSIGPKSAERIAYYILGAPAPEVKALSEALLSVKQTIRSCSRCFNLTTDELCDICRDPRRNPRLLCVVEHTKDIVAIEKSDGFEGRYHVLMGKMSPLSGVGPEDLRIAELEKRIPAEEIEEVVLATSADVEGEATALYLARVLKPLGVRVSRIAYGIPVGSSLDYADQMTLTRALAGRRDI